VRTEEGHKETKLGSVNETPAAQGALGNDIQYIECIMMNIKQRVIT